MTANISEPTDAAAQAQSDFVSRRLQRRPPANPAQFDIKVFADNQEVEAGDGAFIFMIPADLGGRQLTKAAGFVTTVSASGDITVTLENLTQSVDLLDDPIVIEEGELRSAQATTQPAPTDPLPVEAGDMISINVDGAGNGATGLGVILDF